MKNNRLIITLIALFLLGFGLKAQTASTEETAAQKEKRMECDQSASTQNGVVIRPFYSIIAELRVFFPHSINGWFSTSRMPEMSYRK